MMRALLDTSDRIAIARENHYMGHVFGRRGARAFLPQGRHDLTDDNTVRKIVDMIYSGEYERMAGWRPPSPHWYWLIENIDRDELERRLLAAERTERGMFRAFISAYADKKGKPIWGEKTPTHLNFTDELLEWFPDARVLHMLRDPRAIYVSDRYRRQNRDRWPYTWMRQGAAAAGGVPARPDGSHLAQRLAPACGPQGAASEPTIGCSDSRMSSPTPTATCRRSSASWDVAVPEDATSVGLAAQHGMRSSDEGIDPKAASRWRERIHPVAKRFIELAASAARCANTVTRVARAGGTADSDHRPSGATNVDKMSGWPSQVAVRSFSRGGSWVKVTETDSVGRRLLGDHGRAG